MSESDDIPQSVKEEPKPRKTGPVPIVDTPPEPDLPEEESE